MARGVRSLAYYTSQVFHTSQVFLFGAEFTRVYTQHTGAKVQPKRGAAHLPAATIDASGEPATPMTAL